MLTMKPDNEPLFGHSATLCKPDSTQFEYQTDAARMEEIVRNSQKKVFTDLQNYVNIATPLAIRDKDVFLNSPELECTMILEDLDHNIDYQVRNSVATCTTPSSKMEVLEGRDLHTDKDQDENELRDSVVPCRITSGKMEKFEQNKDLCTDKSVMQCELPELLVCYKDDTCHAIKDICVDEGVPTEDKILIESENNVGLFTMLPSVENRDGIMTKESDDDEFLSPDGSMHSSENDDYEHDYQECGTKEEVKVQFLVSDGLKGSLENQYSASIDPVHTRGANHSATEKIVDDVSKERVLTSSVPLLQDFSQQKTLISLLLSSDYDGNEIKQPSDKIPCYEGKCDIPTVVSASQTSDKSNPVTDLPYNGKLETTTIASDLNFSKSAASSASEFQHGQGESSFSMAGTSSGRINYSGPMLLYSGSVSIRSDSSTTSTRSFAFPILQSEWNCSPVKMAKPDRRQDRKHRGWRQALLCCRF